MKKIFNPIIIYHLSFIIYHLSFITQDYWNSIKNVTGDDESTMELLDVYKNTSAIISKNNYVINIELEYGQMSEFYYIDEDNLRVTSCSHLKRNLNKIHNYLLSNESNVILTSIANLV